MRPTGSASSPRGSSTCARRAPGWWRCTPYLGRICAHLSRSIGAARAIDFDQAIEPTTVSAEKALVLGLIANELISNAIKYAFPGDRSGPIAVSFAKDSEKDSAGELVLTVADDGIGCPDRCRRRFRHKADPGSPGPAWRPRPCAKAGAGLPGRGADSGGRANRLNCQEHCITCYVLKSGRQDKEAYAMKHARLLVAGVVDRRAGGDPAGGRHRGPFREAVGHRPRFDRRRDPAGRTRLCASGQRARADQGRAQGHAQPPRSAFRLHGRGRNSSNRSPTFPAASAVSASRFPSRAGCPR